MGRGAGSHCSIECEFDHLFRVELGLTIGWVFCQIDYGLRDWSLGNAHWKLFALRAENI
jgi:hypothetical protein